MNKTTLLSSNEIIDIFSASHIATAIYTTSQLHIEAVTDAMLAYWHKDRTVIGMPLTQALPDIVGLPILHELLEAVNNGTKTSKSNVPFELHINGIPHTRYFDYEFNPMRKASGHVYCVLHTATDVTDRVLGTEAQSKEQAQRLLLEHEQALNEELAAANEELSATNEELNQSKKNLAVLNDELEKRVDDRSRAAETARHRLEAMVMNTPVAMCVLRGDDLIVEIANQPMLTVWRRTQAEVIGRSLVQIFPALKHQPNPGRMRGVMQSGKRFSLPETEVTLSTTEGELKTHYASFSYDPIFEPDGTIGSILVTVVDITTEVNNRRQLQQNSDELAAMNEEMLASNEELLFTQQQLQQKVDELKESEGRFRFLLNAIPQQVWTASQYGALNYVNDVVVDDFGQHPQAIVGQGWDAFIHPEDLHAAREKWAYAIQGNREYLAEFRLKFADDNYYWHLARAVPLIKNGTVSFWIGTNTNIHQQKINDFKKDEFISIASHELKTPLTTVKAFIQLSKRDIKGSINPFVNKAERQLERLERLIDDLLDVSKITAGKMNYNKEEFNLSRVLAETVDNMQQSALHHHIEFYADDSINYFGDQHRIEQVLVNLLNNAIKYSPGKDKIIVRCQQEAQNVIISVQDFGIGIHEEHLKGLFDRFYRVDNSSARFQGLGLGLFIANEIVKRHGGSFWIESMVDEGSVFYFLLPLNGRLQLADIGTDEQTYYEGNFIKIQYRPQGNYMDVEWLGYQNYDSVVKGCGILLKLMQQNNCSLVLNDNTLVKGNWSEAADWGAEIWFPAMAAAGLKKFAWIYSPSTFSRIAANKSLPSEYDAVQVAFFDNKASASEWLLK